MLGFLGKMLKGLKRKIRIRRAVRLGDTDFAYSKEDSEKVEELKKKMRALEEARGYAEGEKAYQTVVAKKYESLLKGKKKVNISKVAHEKAETIQRGLYKGGFSWRKFFKSLEKNPKKYGVYSYNLRKKFGLFFDFGILPDGRSIVYVDNGKSIQPVIVGRTPKEMLRQFSGLNHTVGKGIIAVNLDENGEYFENIEEMEVPDVIVDGNGRIAVTRFDQESFIRRLAERSKTINSLVEKYKPLEKMYASASVENIVKEIGDDLSTKRAEEYEAVLQKQMADISGILQSWNSMQQNLVLSANAQKTYEQMASEWEKLRDKLFQKIERALGGDERENIKKEIKNDMDETLNHLKKMAEASSKQYPAPVITPSVASLPGKPRI